MSTKILFTLHMFLSLSPAESISLESWPIDISFTQLLDYYVVPEDQNSFFVNIGAQGGDIYDPVYPLIKSGKFSGIMFEGDMKWESHLRNVMQPFNKDGKLQIVMQYAYPDTIAAKLRDLSCPIDLDVLKIDIDSIDLLVLTAIIEGGIKPKLLMVEINSDIPPPFLYHYTGAAAPPGRQRVVGDFGVSTESMYQFLTNNGYNFISMELGSNRDRKCVTCEHNMWFVKRELAAARPQLPGWVNHIAGYWQQQFNYSDFAASKHPHAAKTLVGGGVRLRCLHMPKHLCLFHYIAPVLKTANYPFQAWDGWSQFSEHLKTKAGEKEGIDILTRLKGADTALNGGKFRIQPV